MVQILFFFILSTHSLFGWERIYLATYPRSGNHWTRYLIEEVSNIATSSVYCDGDPQHMSNIFPWGGYCCSGGYEGHCRYPTPEEAVVIKTHYPALNASEFDLQTATKTIRITRHPVDSIYSFYLYLYENVYDKAPPSARIPHKQLKKFVRQWHRFQSYWDQKDNTLTLRYEDLYHNPTQTLQTLITAIGYPVKQEDIERAVKRYPPKGGLLKHCCHFKDKDLEYIYKELAEDMKRHGYECVSSTGSILLQPLLQ